ncbi:MAG: hypothetical protein V3574_00765 [Candidatus Moraniibacteriota bacterium]
MEKINFNENYAPNNSDNSKLSEIPKDDLQKARLDLLKEKMVICRADTTEKLGAVNIYESARKLYYALYFPDKIEEFVATNDKYPERMSFLKRALSDFKGEIPSEEEFIAKIRHAMTNKVSYDRTFPREAREVFKEVLSLSEHTFIWTKGDVGGYPDKNIPGSKEQLKKMGSAKFYNQVRREIARERGVHHGEVMSIVATEDKMSRVPQMVDKFKEKGISTIFIIEDTKKNLIEAVDVIKENYPEVKIFPVWIDLSKKGKKSESFDDVEIIADEKTGYDIYVISNIEQLDSVLEKNNLFNENNRVGSIFDLDGPLHNDELRKDLQTRAVYDELIKNNWI